MTCLNVLEHAEPRYGGIAVSVPALARAMDRHCRNQNAAFCHPAESQAPGIVRFPLSRLAWFTGNSTRLTFDRLAADADLLHIHGLWSHHAVAARRAAERNRKPYIVSAHGMLDPWALHNKTWKKRMYSMLVERKNLAGAACLRALTLDEAADYRRYGLRAPIAVVPNGIDVPPSLWPAAFLRKFPELRGRRIALFLGRVHFKKGLDLLCRAWAAALREPGTHLVIAGPDSEGTRANLEALIATLGIGPQVTFTGMLERELKWSALAAAHVFVLPSYSEGFSVAVLEALSAGVPVIVSRQCHLPEIAARGCGWVVPTRTAALAEALGEALALTPAGRERYAASGRRLVEECFAWPIVAARMAAVYEWVLGGPRPHSVEVIE
jgi:glycosyltransferase involved in cell wall biosynthesis